MGGTAAERFMLTNRRFTLAGSRPSNLSRELRVGCPVAYGADVGRILDSAITTYRRSPGLDSLSRLYAQNIGEEGIDALHHALLRNRARQFHVLDPGIEMRHCLRLHLVHCLRTSSMMETRLAVCATSILPPTWGCSLVLFQI